ncbi:MAG: CotH kinase family protein, partial [Pirellulales bacterium]
GRVSDFNLLSNYADKTKIRNTLAYEVYREAGHAGHQAFPVRIEKNGSFYAVQDWVEEGDAEYLEDNDLDPNGALYKVDNSLNSPFTDDVKKRTRKYEDRSDLAELVASAKLSPEERDAWFLDNIDLASFANFLAAMVVTANVDCCHKNYYVYRDTEGTGQWQILPWDLDLSFGHNWNGSEGYFDDDLVATAGFFQGNAVISPLYNAPGFRQMYLRRLRTLMDELLQPPGTPTDELRFEARIDELIEEIGDDAALDQAKWGFPGPFVPQTAREAADDVKNIFFPARREFLYNTYNQSAAEVNRIPDAQVGVPEIQIAEIESDPASGNLDEQYIRLVNSNSVAVDISNWRLGGDIDYRFRPGTVIPADGALYITPSVKAFLARTSGPSGGQELFVQGNLKGHLPTSGASVELIPLAGRPLGQLDALRITELNYNPHDPVDGQGELDVDNDRFEFIELTNTGDTSIQLQGARFTDGIRFTFGDVDLPAGERILVVRNQAAFESRYGSGLPIAGEFESGKLSNGGETIRLEDFHRRTIVRFTYDDRGAWPSRADGLGGSLEVIDTEGDYSDAANWRSSVLFAGSPGAAGSEPLNDILINEVLARPAAGEADQIELTNTTIASIDLSGWYLSNGGNDLLKYRLPDGTTIGAGSYLAIDTAAVGFALDGLQGGELWLIESDANGKPLRFVQQVEFGGASEGTSLGRWRDGDPSSLLLPMGSTSFGATNTGPLDTGVMISEVHYNPASTGDYTNDFETS